MKLLRIHVENFGKLQNLSMDLSKDLYILHAENGWGKSTLAVFIKAMLYGLPATRTRSLDENERKKYAPWQGGAYGGSLEFQTAKGKFRIERFFGEKESGDTFALYDLATNRPTDLYSDPVGEALFGIDAEGFERTVYLSQRRLPKGDNNSITAKLADLLDDVDDIGSYDNAVAALDKRRQYYVIKGGKGRIKDLEDELSDAQRELESLARTQEVLEGEEHEFAARSERIRDLRTDLEDIRADIQKAGNMRERQAHLEQYRRMENELAELRQREHDLDLKLSSKHPSEGQLEEWRRNIAEWQRAKSVYDSIPKEAVRPVRTERLPLAYIDRCPDRSHLEKMLVAAKALEQLNARENTLRAAMDENISTHFQNGIPDDTRIQSVMTAWDRAKAQSKEGAEKRSRAAELPGGKLCIWALLLTVASAAGGILWWPFFIAAALFGALTVIFTIRSSQKAKDARSAMLQEAVAAEENADRARDAVARFLLSYGYRPDSSDLTATLMHLSIDAANCRNRQKDSADRQRELAAIVAEKPKHESFLRAAFPLFGLSMPPLSDCRDTVEALRRDLDQIHFARMSEQERRGKLTQAELSVKECENALSSFRMTYDPRATLSYAVLFNGVCENEKDYRRTKEEIRKRSDALAAFRLEKHLDAIGEEQPLDYDILVSREKILQNELTAFEGEHTRQQNRINLLSDKTERIPELENSIAALTDALSDAKAGYKTVSETQKYLEAAKEGLSTRYLGGMQTSFTRFLSVLTADAPPEAVMDPSFAVSLREGGKTREMESFSRGWRDAVEFCTRLSLADALYAEGEKPFLLLDDPFVNLDDRRLSAAQHLLETLSHEYQIIHMVCHSDRR